MYEEVTETAIATRNRTMCPVVNLVAFIVSSRGYQIVVILWNSTPFQIFDTGV
jgi:hypothetical protein